MAHDVVLVTYNYERGFWQADLYHEASAWDRHVWDSAPEPDAFITMRKGDTRSDAASKAAVKWPRATIRILDDDDHEIEDE